MLAFGKGLPLSVIVPPAWTIGGGAGFEQADTSTSAAVIAVKDGKRERDA
jgi:hypothetical protein